MTLEEALDDVDVAGVAAELADKPVDAAGFAVRRRMARSTARATIMSRILRKRGGTPMDACSVEMAGTDSEDARLTRRGKRRGRRARLLIATMIGGNGQTRG